MTSSHLQNKKKRKKKIFLLALARKIMHCQSKNEYINELIVVFKKQKKWPELQRDTRLL